MGAKPISWTKKMNKPAVIFVILFIAGAVGIVVLCSLVATLISLIVYELTLNLVIQACVYWILVILFSIFWLYVYVVCVFAFLGFLADQ